MQDEIRLPNTVQQSAIYRPLYPYVCIVGLVAWLSTTGSSSRKKRAFLLFQSKKEGISSFTHLRQTRCLRCIDHKDLFMQSKLRCGVYTETKTLSVSVSQPRRGWQKGKQPLNSSLVLCRALKRRKKREGREIYLSLFLTLSQLVYPCFLSVLEEPIHRDL